MSYTLEATCSELAISDAGQMATFHGADRPRGDYAKVSTRVDVSFESDPSFVPQFRGRVRITIDFLEDAAE